MNTFTYMRIFHPGKFYGLLAAFLMILSFGLLGTVFSVECEYEDSRNCYWDAHTMGNGEGRSFVDVAGVVYYVP